MKIDEIDESDESDESDEYGNLKFLGHFQPQQDKPALWELDSDQHYNIGRRDLPFGEEKNRSTFKRSLSDGNILSEADTPMSTMSIGMKKFSNSIVPGKLHGGRVGISESTPDVSTNENGISYGRYTPSMTCRQLFTNAQSNPIHLNGNVGDMKEESKLLNEDEQKSVNEYSEAFRLWVSNGETFCF
ncbi:hypothetical protein Syun_026649 [Stephania yunnanensis]|uniref:Uncharacterized protein n=1 Tax=Stephania yunnanensis TaxID=152371 RepID=A0AAP0EUC7_9MAGN